MAQRPLGPTPLRVLLSRSTGWLADRRVPLFLRSPLYRTFCRLTGARIDEARPPLDGYPSLGAFFVRRLKEGARPLPEDRGLLVSPVDGRLQAFGPVHEGEILQAKGRRYELRELLAGVGQDLELEGGLAWTLYLSPRDYHRVHAPLDLELEEAAWVPGALRSVRPSALARDGAILATNERVVLRVRGPAGALLIVLVGALNVGRLRVVGVRPGASGPLEPRLRFARGAELGRFELGSTVVLIAPRGSLEPLPGRGPGAPVRVGEPLARVAFAQEAAAR